MSRKYIYSQKVRKVNNLLSGHTFLKRLFLPRKSLCLDKFGTKHTLHKAHNFIHFPSFNFRLFTFHTIRTATNFERWENIQKILYLFCLCNRLNQKISFRYTQSTFHKHRQLSWPAKFTRKDENIPQTPADLTERKILKMGEKTRYQQI